MELIAFDMQDTPAPLSDGGSVPLVQPPGGGGVMFVGARAKNLDPCGAELNARITQGDTQTGPLEARTVNLELTCDGWAQSADPWNSSALPVCPNLWSMADVYGNPYGLTIRVTDANGRTAATSIQVTPQCSEPWFEGCLCICRAGYMLGQPCDPTGPGG
jgi:hypothetical protein